MVKVLHCVGVMNLGGQETFIMNVFRRIDTTEIQFDFLLTDDRTGDYDSEISALGGKIFYLPSQRYGGGLKKYTEKARLLTKWLKDHRDDFDILHLHTYHALEVLIYLAACKKAKIDQVVVHSHNTRGAHRKVHGFCRTLNRFFSFRKLACSEEAGRWLFGDKSDFEVVPNGIDFERFRFRPEIRKKIRDELEVSDQTTVFGHVGRFFEQKNHEFLIEVFSRYSVKNPDAVLWLIGDGEKLEEIKALAERKKIGEKVVFFGKRKDVAEMLQAMDVFLFPSLYEGLPLVGIEVQIAGIPAVFSDRITADVRISEKLQMADLSFEAWLAAMRNAVTQSRAESRILEEKAKFYNIDHTVESLVRIYRTMER